MHSRLRPVIPGLESKSDHQEKPMKVEGTCKVKDWKETTYREMSAGKKLTKASVEYEFRGGIEGKASAEYLMSYSHADPKDQHNSSAAYLGLMYFEGTVQGKSGSFVLEDNGTYDAGIAVSQLRIARGSGAGELEGIHGTGKYEADREGNRIELEYRVD
jgi:hypothetical protein